MQEVIVSALLFLKIGALSFGDGNAMIPIIYENLREFHLISYESFVNMLAVSQITPGPIAMNLATYIGMDKGGILGAILVTTCVALPSTIVAILAVKLWEKFKDNTKAKGFLEGVRSAALGLIGSTVVLMFKGVSISFLSVAIVLGAFFSVVILKLKPIVVLGLSALVGAIFLV